MRADTVVSDVPAYERFLTVDELNASGQRLASTHPRQVKQVPIGRSSDGETINMLRIGNGPEQLLFFACPHPNEPIGAMTLEYLSRRLAEDDSLRGTRYTWNIIKCIDPDGTRLNEGWFNGPFTVTNYARNFYRPASFQQAEWTFPIVYKDLVYLTPISETQALMSAIAGLAPRFVYSLHNAGFGGGYYYLWPEQPSAYENLRGIMRDRNVPLSLGEPEMPWAVTFSPAVYQVPSVRDNYDFLERFASGSPADQIGAGASSFEFARAISDPAMLICELPYFYDPRIEDVQEAQMTRREALLEGIERTQEITGFLTRLFDGVSGELTATSRFRTAVDSMLKLISAGDEAKRAWAQSTPELTGPATEAQVFDNLLVGRFYRLLVCGMAVRALDHELACRHTAAVAEARQRAAEAFDRWAGDLEVELDYQVIPIKTLVEIQLAAALEVLSHR